MNFDELKSRAIAVAEEEFAKARAEKDIPGIAFGLLYENDLVYSSGLGETKKGNGTKPDLDSVFRIASMTKSFTAQAILLLRDRNLLRLEDEITRYLPWTATIGQPNSSDPITIWHLLTMGAGFPTDDPWGDRQEDLPLAEFDRLVAGGLTFNRNVNEGFEYSNLGYALLGRIIAVVSGSTFEEFVKAEILEPLELTSTTYFSEEVDDARRAHGHVNFPSGTQIVPTVKTGAFTPMGGLHSTVRDIASWVKYFRSGHLEAQTPARHVRSAVVPAEGEIPERVIASHYGYGIFIDDDAELGRFTSHSGGYPGFGSHMRWHRESGWSIIGLANLTYAPMSVISAKILNQIAWLEKQSNPRSPDLHPETRNAMDLVEGLLRDWNEEVVDQNFAVNMDLDCPRSDRREEFAIVGQQFAGFARVDNSLSSSAKSHAKWKVAVDSKELEVEVLISPEKPPKVQKIVLKEILPEEVKS